MSSNVLSVSFSANMQPTNFLLHNIQARAQQLQIRGWVLKFDPDNLAGVLVGRREDVANMKASIINFIQAHARAATGNVHSVEFEDEHEMANINALPPQFLVLSRCMCGLCCMCP